MRFSIFVFLSLSLVTSAAFGADDAPYQTGFVDQYLDAAQAIAAGDGIAA